MTEMLKTQNARQHKQQETRIEDIEEAAKRNEQAWNCKSGQDEYNLTLQGPEPFFWRGSEAGLLRIFDFPGIQAGGDGSEEPGKMPPPF